MLCILEVTSIGYYKIKHGILQQILSEYFRLEFDVTDKSPFSIRPYYVKKKTKLY